MHKIGTFKCSFVWCGPLRSILCRKRSGNVSGHFVWWGPRKRCFSTCMLKEAWPLDLSSGQLCGVGHANDASAHFSTRVVLKTWPLEFSSAWCGPHRSIPRFVFVEFVCCRVCQVIICMVWAKQMALQHMRCKNSRWTLKFAFVWCGPHRLHLVGKCEH